MQTQNIKSSTLRNLATYCSIKHTHRLTNKRSGISNAAEGNDSIKK